MKKVTEIQKNGLTLRYIEIGGLFNLDITQPNGDKIRFRGLYPSAFEYLTSEYSLKNEYQTK